MPKNIWYDNQQMTTRKKIILVAVVALVAMGITNTGETKKMTPAQMLQGAGTFSNQNTGSYLQPAATIDYLQPAATPQQLQPAGPSDGGVTLLLGDQNTAQTGPTPEQIAAEQRQTAARSSFNQGRTNILDSIRNAGQNFVQTGRANILDFVEGLRTQQQGLDTQRANAALGKRNAVSGIQNMVGQGIRSSGVQLANRNAGDSSAALGLAQAYGRMGNQRMQDVNQQFGLENANLDVAQQNLDVTRESGLRRFDLEKEQTINKLTADAQQQFATLNQMAEGAGIMDRIAIEQEKENIKNQLIQQLAELDARGSASAVRPMDQMGIQNRAQELANLGGNTGTQFDFTGVAPATMQTGAALSQLPIFSNRRRRD